MAAAPKTTPRPDSTSALPTRPPAHERSVPEPLRPPRHRRQGWRAHLRANWLRLLTHIGALLPFAQLVWDALHHQLTVNPIREATYRTGKTALVLLLLSLLCTPANVLLGWRGVRVLRRPLGLYAFFYATLHLLIFAVVDYGLDWGLIWETVLEKRYVVAGFSAFLLLVPLVLTSTAGWQRRLRQRWAALHRLVYLAAGLAVLHFYWLAKGDKRDPLHYALALAALLLLRWGPVRQLLVKARQRVWPSKPARRPAVAAHPTSPTSPTH